MKMQCSCSKTGGKVQRKVLRHKALFPSSTVSLNLPWVSYLLFNVALPGHWGTNRCVQTPAGAWGPLPQVNVPTQPTRCQGSPPTNHQTRALEWW